MSLPCYGNCELPQSVPISQLIQFTSTLLSSSLMRQHVKCYVHSAAVRLTPLTTLNITISGEKLMSKRNFFLSFPMENVFISSLCSFYYTVRLQNGKNVILNILACCCYAGSEFHCDSQFSSLSLAFAAVRAQRIQKIYFMFYDTEKNARNETSNSHSCFNRRSSKNTACASTLNFFVEVKKGKLCGIFVFLSFHIVVSFERH